MGKFTVNIPDEIMLEFKIVADEEGCDFKEVLIECLRFGMIGMATRNKENEKLLIENEEGTKEIIFTIGGG